jgi:hypothetical protein
MRTVFAALLGATLSCASATAVAAQPTELTAEIVARWSDQQLLAEIGNAERGGDEKQCRREILLVEMAKRHPASLINAMAASAAGHCAIYSGRPAEALDAFNRAEALFPNDTDAETRRELDMMAAFAAADAKNGKGFAEHVGHIVNRNDPDEFAGLTHQFWGTAFHEADVPWAGRAALALARASSFEHLPEGTAEIVRYWATRPAIEAGDKALALRLVLAKPDPETMAAMLVDRGYTPIWPELEVAAGPKLQ